MWYLINGLLDGSYQIQTFCDEFTHVYDLEDDYDELSKDEDREFNELCVMTGRFGDDEEVRKNNNVYYSGDEVIKKAREIKNTLCEYKQIATSVYEQEILLFIETYDKQKSLDQLCNLADEQWHTYEPIQK